MGQKTENSFQNQLQDTKPATLSGLRPLRPLLVLEQLTSAMIPMTLAQLAVRVHSPKNTLARILDALEDHGYVQRLAGQRGYVPGPCATELALQTLRGERVSRACRGVLQALVTKTGETCNLTALDGDQVRYIERVETSHPLRMVLEPGTKVPLHCTASGKLFLASMPLLERRDLLKRIPLDRITPDSITSPHTLEKEFVSIAKKKVGIDNEEFIQGMIAVAVPVYDKQKRVIAAIACHAPTARVSMNDLFALIPRMRIAASAISDALSID